MTNLTITIAIDHPIVRLLGMEGEWSALGRLCEERLPTGNQLPGAWMAKAVLQHRQILGTFVHNFKRLLPAKQLPHLLPANP